MTEPNYQKPPLREEIEAFFKQLEGVIFTIISIIAFIAVLFGLYEFTKTDIAHQIGNYINEHFPAFMLTIMIEFLSYAILCGALYRKHLTNDVGIYWLFHLPIAKHSNHPLYRWLNPNHHH